jgi:hypothetical protein
LRISQWFQFYIHNIFQGTIDCEQYVIKFLFSILTGCTCIFPIISHNQVTNCLQKISPIGAMLMIEDLVRGNERRCFLQNHRARAGCNALACSDNPCIFKHKIISFWLIEKRKVIAETIIMCTRYASPAALAVRWMLWWGV